MDEFTECVKEIHVHFDGILIRGQSVEEIMPLEFFFWKDLVEKNIDGFDQFDIEWNFVCGFIVLE